MTACECSAPHQRRRIVLTGGPGAGKTALLELIRQSFCSHVTVLPAAANVGPNPTFGEKARKIELHLLDYAGDLYGKTLSASFVVTISTLLKSGGAGAGAGLGALVQRALLGQGYRGMVAQG